MLSFLDRARAELSDIEFSDEKKELLLQQYEQKKKELENRIAFALQAGKYEDAKKISQELEKLLRKYNG